MGERFREFMGFMWPVFLAMALSWLSGFCVGKTF